VIDDNTWATPLYHRSLEFGAGISIQAATKYVGGHCDVMFGTVSANAKTWPIIAETICLLGVCAGPDDVFLALRQLSDGHEMGTGGTGATSSHRA
jgi:cysteine-S-conjugate beta-lyase